MKEDIKFLKELQEKLKTQETDSQAAPRFWVIVDYEQAVTAEGYHDNVAYYSPKHCKYYDLNEIIELLKEQGELREDVLSDFEENIEFSWFDNSDILNWLEENFDKDICENYTVNVFKIMPDTFFITKEEAKEHLRLNTHHYSSKAHTYAMTAWRAPTVERLWKILETFDWGKIQNTIIEN